MNPLDNHFPKLDEFFEYIDNQLEKIKQVRFECELNSILTDNEIESDDTTK